MAAGPSLLGVTRCDRPRRAECTSPTAQSFLAGCRRLLQRTSAPVAKEGTLEESTEHGTWCRLDRDTASGVASGLAPAPLAIFISFSGASPWKMPRARPFTLRRSALISTLPSQRHRICWQHHRHHLSPFSSLVRASAPVAGDAERPAPSTHQATDVGARQVSALRPRAVRRGTRHARSRKADDATSI
jgi:hypothetical protein